MIIALLALKVPVLAVLVTKSTQMLGRQIQKMRPEPCWRDIDPETIQDEIALCLLKRHGVVIDGAGHILYSVRGETLREFLYRAGILIQRAGRPTNERKRRTPARPKENQNTRDYQRSGTRSP